MIGSFFIAQNYICQPPGSGNLLMICAGMALATRISAAEILMAVWIAAEIDIEARINGTIDISTC